MTQSNLRADIKARVEQITSLNVYPSKVPNGSSYPCLVMSIAGGSRNGSSNLTDVNLRDYRLSLTIMASTASECYSKEDQLIESLDNKPLNTDDTNLMMIRYDNTLEILNYDQDLYELNVDFILKNKR